MNIEPWIDALIVHIAEGEGTPNPDYVLKDFKICYEVITRDEFLQPFQYTLLKESKVFLEPFGMYLKIEHGTYPDKLTRELVTRDIIYCYYNEEDYKKLKIWDILK
jgi:hypothetical protein